MTDVRARYRERLAALVDDGYAASLGLEGDWRRTFGRFHPGADPWAVLAFQSGDGRRAVRVDVSEAGTRVTDADDDPGLRGLRLLRGGTIVRYRPGRRCVVRTAEGYAKVLAGGEGAAIHADGVGN